MAEKLLLLVFHLSWWDKGFQEEWARIEERFKAIGKPLILAGDFNNPAGREGHQAILASSLNLQDSFEVAKETTGSYTVGPGIDVWKGNEGAFTYRLCLC